ncbi:MAG: cysteine synthase family protein [Alphaproteobacteria bacterium]|nr:cysteine synthase family protein [Alphaproteobacteria bacterium]MBE6467429.1 cysteine synthase family protein [Alphaproteobacteria bacterium]
MRKIFDSISEMIGSTPMLKINNLKEKLSLKSNIFAKCEFYNPLFSIKDRAGLRIIENALQKNNIDNDSIFVEATSGNIGVAIAGICASKNLKALLVMPEDTSTEKVKMIKHLGADVILTPKSEGMNGAIAKTEMLANKSDKVILLKQFTNQASVDAHMFGTATEILNDMGGNIDVIIASVGTSGTLTGVAQALKTSNPDLYVVAVEPLASNVLNGGPKGSHKIRGIGAGFVPPLYKKELVDEVFDVSDEDAWDMAKAIAQTEGLPIGISSGAVFVAAVDIATREKFKDKNIVVILPDAITNYLSEL